MEGLESISKEDLEREALILECMMYGLEVSGEEEIETLQLYIQAAKAADDDMEDDDFADDDDEFDDFEDEEDAIAEEEPSEDEFYEEDFDFDDDDDDLLDEDDSLP